MFVEGWIMHTRYLTKTTKTWLRRCRRGLLAAALAGAFLLAITSANAQQADSRESQSRSECLAGRFQAGVDLLAQMFVETGDANYIYNQGRCYEQNGKFSEAILRFREFLRKAKNLSADDKAEVNGHINDCQAELDRRPGPTPDTGSGAKPVTTTEPEVKTAVSPLPADAADGRGSGLRAAGIVAASVGVAALAAGIVLSIETRNIANQVTTDYANNTYDRNKDDLGKLLGELQWVGYGVGALGLVGGGLLYYFGYQAGHASASSSVSFMPMLLPGGSGAVLQGRF
jgi:tetratricopeptide (TPR) repeat protein